MLSRKQLTTEQQRAVDALEQHCVVIAGPGAGKTRVLVERTLNILRGKRANLEEIAAITFTKKAANEMKERMRQELAALARESKNRMHARYWADLRRRLEHAEISTIHGLCASILRAQPVEVKLDPAFIILDDYTGRLLLSQAAEDAVNDLLESYSDAMARLVIGYGRQELADILKDLYGRTRNLGLPIDDIERLTWENLAHPEAYAECVRKAEAIINDLVGLDNLTPTMREQVAELGQTWHKHRNVIDSNPELGNSLYFDRSLRRLTKAVPDAKGRLKEPVTELREQLKELELVFYDSCSQETLKTIIQLLHDLDKRYRAEKESRRAVDYEDLQWKIRDLFKSDPYIARRYSEKYRYVLIDEFQDTNGLQKEIVELLTFGRDRNNNLFLVGDANQSIYNFRGAEVEVFEATARHMIERGAAEIRLEENFRSAPQLIAFFNAFFSRLMQPTPETDDKTARLLGYVPYGQGKSTRTSPESKAAVEWLIELGEHIETSEQARELEAENIARRIGQMVRNSEKLVAETMEDGSETLRDVRYSDIAMLFRAITDIKVYEQALRRAGIPYYVLAGKGFYEREEIQDVISLLRFLENRTDQIALVAALRSPLFGISDETLYRLRQHSWKWEGTGMDPYPMFTSLMHHEEIHGIEEEQMALLASAAETIGRLLELRNRVSLVELVEEALRSTNYAAIQATFYDGYQRAANLSKLIDLARGFEATGPYFLSDFIRFVRQFTEMESREAEAQLESGQQNAVQLMTIHKAKGLEFPVVILPDLARRFQTQARDLTFDRSLGLGIKTPDMSGKPHETALHRKVADRLKLREMFENQRLFFVAATRARDYLVLSGAADCAKRDKSISEAQCYLDWLFSILPYGEGGESTGMLEWEGLLINMPKRESMSEPAPQEPPETENDKLEAAAETSETQDTSQEAKDEKPETDADDSESVSTIVERYPEIGYGLPCLFEADESCRAARETITKRLEPLVIPIESRYQRLAVTKLLAFARCPLQYYYETVLELPESDSYEGLGSAKLSATEKGKVVHRFCELYDGTQAPEEVFQRAVQKENLPYPTSDIKEETWPLIEKYLSGPFFQQIARLLKTLGPKAVQSEVDFVYRTSHALLRGRIDKLTINEQGQATIIDFKTNRITLEQVERTAKEYELQMRVYALVAKGLMGLENVRAQLYFLEPNVLYDIGPDVLNPASTAHAVDTLCEALLKANATKSFVANPEVDRCRHCSCYAFCPDKAV